MQLELKGDDKASEIFSENFSEADEAKSRKEIVVKKIEE